MARKKIQELYNSGITNLSEIARQVGCTRQRVHQIIGANRSGFCSHCGEELPSKKMITCYECLLKPEVLAEKHKEKLEANRKTAISRKKMCACGKLMGETSKTCFTCNKTRLGNLRKVAVVSFCKEELMEFAEELEKNLGHFPTSQDWIKSEKTPNFIHIKKNFGTWRAFKEYCETK